MNVYEFKWPNNEFDWILAPNIKEAKEFYLNLSGCVDINGCKVKRIARRYLKEMYLTHPNYRESDEIEGYNEDDYCNGYKIIETLADYVKRENSIDIIATSAF